MKNCSLRQTLATRSLPLSIHMQSSDSFCHGEVLTSNSRGCESHGWAWLFREQNKTINPARFVSCLIKRLRYSLLTRFSIKVLEKVIRDTVLECFAWLNHTFDTRSEDVWNFTHTMLRSASQEVLYSFQIAILEVKKQWERTINVKCVRRRASKIAKIVDMMVLKWKRTYLCSAEKAFI